MITSSNGILSTENPVLRLNINSEKLEPLLRSNISCHINKPLTQELIESLTKQIVESIHFFLNKKDD